MGGRSRKRFRITLVCNVCKSRKVKCDRKEPCSSCVSYRTPHLCRYTETVSGYRSDVSDTETCSSGNGTNSMASDDSTGTNIGKILKLFHEMDDVVGINPVHSLNDTWSPYQTRAIVKYPKNDTRRMDFLPYTFHGILRRDPALLDLWYTLTDSRESILKERDNDDHEVQQPRFFEQESFRDIVASKRMMMKIRYYLELRLKNKPTSANMADSSVTATSDSEIFLPPAQAIWEYLDIYIQNVYKYLPFIDEESLRRELVRLLATNTDGNGYAISNERDYAIVGQILIIMRLAYLSLTPNNPNVRKFDSTRFAVGVEYVDMAKKCLQQFTFTTDVDLNMVQCCLYVCIYLTLAPEDNDGPDKNQFQQLNGLLISMARSISLNRDPSKIKELSPSLKISHLRRKIWYEVLFIDFKLVVLFGNPPLIDKKYYDTDSPFYFEGCSNLSHNPDIEKDILSYNSRRDSYMDKTMDFMQRLLDINHPVKVSETAQYLSEMETLLHQDFGSMKLPHIGFLQQLNLRLFFTLRVFHMSLYHDMLLYYNIKENSQYILFYYKKLLLYTVHIIPSFIDALGGKLPFLSPNDFTYELLVNPWLEHVVHRSNGGIFASVIKSVFTLYKSKKRRQLFDDPIVSILEQHIALLTSICKINIVGVSQISDRYWFGWKLVKSHSLFLNTICSSEYFGSDKNEEVKVLREERLNVFDIPDHELQKINTSINKSLKKYSHVFVGKLWKIISDVSEITKNVSDETMEAARNEESSGSSLNSSPLLIESYIGSEMNQEINEYWVNSLKTESDKNFLSHLGLELDDVNTTIGLKEFQDVINSRSKYDESFLQSLMTIIENSDRKNSQEIDINLNDNQTPTTTNPGEMLNSHPMTISIPTNHEPPATRTPNANSNPIPMPIAIHDLTPNPTPTQNPILIPIANPIHQISTLIQNPMPIPIPNSIHEPTMTPMQNPMPIPIHSLIHTPIHNSPIIYTSIQNPATCVNQFHSIPINSIPTHTTTIPIPIHNNSTMHITPIHNYINNGIPTNNQTDVQFDNNQPKYTAKQEESSDMRNSPS